MYIFYLYMLLFGKKMDEPLYSSTELSDISDLSDHGNDKMTVTPICPVCRKNYSDKVKPMVLQPCGHGICNICLSTMKDYVEEDLDDNGNPVLGESRIKCPTCRITIVHERPNYDLREITANVNIDHLDGYWEKQIFRMCEVKGVKIKFSKGVRMYAKPICMRIAYDETFVNMTDGPTLWTTNEKDAVLVMKNALIRCAINTGDDIDVLCKWIGVLSFTKHVQRYFLAFFLEWYEHRDFLKEMNGVWIMDVITHPV